MSPDDDPFGGLDDDQYVPPESDVDPDEYVDEEDEVEEAPDEEPDPEEPETEPDEGDEPEEEAPDEGPDTEEPEPDAEPEEEPPEIQPDEEGVARIPPPDAGDEPAGGAPDEEEGGFDALDEGQYVPPESDVDPDEYVDDDPDEEAPPPVAAGPTPDPEDQEAPTPEPTRERGPEEPPDEDLRIEDVLSEPEEEPPEPEEPEEPEPDDPGWGAPEDEEEPEPEEEEEEPLPAGPAGAEPEEGPGDEEPEDPGSGTSEPDDEGPDDPRLGASEDEEEPEPEEPDEPSTPPPGAGPPEGADERRDREPPSLPGVGAVLVAEVLDGLGSRRVAWTMAGLAVALLGAAYWRGLSDTAWFLRTAFALIPVLLLPAFLLRCPVERVTGHDRVVGTYPVGRGRYLLGRYLAYLLLGLAYLALAAAVAGPVAYYSGPYWVSQLPYHAGVGALVVAATASLGVLLGPLLGARSSWGAGLVGLVVAALMYVAPRGIYVVEEYVRPGSLLELASVRLLHLAPPVAATSLLSPPEVFPVLGAPLVELAVLPVLAVLFLAVGGLGFARLQGPGGWKVHPVLVAAFGLLVLAALAAPAAFPVDLDRGDPIVVQDRSSSADVTVEPVLDLRGASGGATVDQELTLGVSYDGFLALEFHREDAGNGTTLTDVTAAVESDALGVDGEDDLGDVSVPASGEDANSVPVEVPVDVDTVPGALDPAPATAVVEVTSDQANFTLVADDLETATVGNQPVQWFPAAVVGAVMILQGGILAASRRRL